jgi:tRNA pseudouridine38-40 synthase
MVRSLTGFCVAVGLGKREAETFEAVIEAKDRAAAPPIAPPHGLTLKHVTYGETHKQDQ